MEEAWIGRGLEVKKRPESRRSRDSCHGGRMGFRSRQGPARACPVENCRPDPVGYPLLREENLIGQFVYAAYLVTASPSPQALRRRFAAGSGSGEQSCAGNEALCQ